MLIRLVYVSRCHARAENDLTQIFDWSRRVNPDLGITGVLLYLDEAYMQYLEGDDYAVDRLFESIGRDTRHRGVTRLERREIPKRAFPEWSMATLEWSDNTRNIFHSFAPGKKLDLYAADQSTAAPMIRALIRAPGWKLV